MLPKSPLMMSGPRRPGSTVGTAGGCIGSGVQNVGDEGLAEDMVQETFVRLWRTEGRTQPQIAELLGLPPGTVKTRTYHGIRELRTALIERGFHAV